MENFIVSARKYRPQTFDTVVGQKSITNTLKNAIRNNQLAQAFLFCGPRGVGKTTCARILAKTINCENPSPEMEACDKCTSCVSFNENASFNIYELDGASNNSVDEIRSLVDKVRIPPQMGKYKVYIIDEVHMLSASAFNAFLKTLEEPPAYAKFILATTEKHKIIPTILSRCQIFDFKRIQVEDIVEHLKFVAAAEGITAEDNALHIIGQKADGAMRDALSIFDQLVSFAGNNLTYEAVLENLNVLDYEYFFRITGEILAGDIPSTLLTINEILDMGFDGQHFMTGFGSHLRNLMVCKDPATVRLIETAPGIRQRYLEQSSLCPVDFLLKALDINNRCDLAYKVSNNKQLHLELALMQMCTLMKEPVKSAPRVEPQQTKPAPPPEKKTPAEPIKAETPEVKEQKNVFRTISIKDKPVKDDPKKEEEQGTEISGHNRPNDPFTNEQLYNLWDEFGETLKLNMPHLCAALKKYRPVIRENFMIEFTLDNKVLEENLREKKGDLLEFLMKNLNNYSITLHTTVPEHPLEIRPYTDREKFARMAGKNPSLLDLREQFDLDLD